MCCARMDYFAAIVLALSRFVRAPAKQSAANSFSLGTSFLG